MFNITFSSPINNWQLLISTTQNPSWVEAHWRMLSLKVTSRTDIVGRSVAEQMIDVQLSLLYCRELKLSENACCFELPRYRAVLGQKSSKLSIHPKQKEKKKERKKERIFIYLFTLYMVFWIQQRSYFC
jgi:hypothetical protein